MNTPPPPPPPPAPCLTICLVVERHQLDAMQPEGQGVGVGRVDARGGWVGPEELAGGVLNQLLGVTAAQTLGCVLVDGGDVVALWSADYGTQGGAGVEDGRRLLLPAQALALGATWREGGPTAGGRRERQSNGSTLRLESERSEAM